MKMIKSVIFFVLLSALMFADYGSTRITYLKISPYTLWDQAKDQLNLLKQVVDASVLTAQNQLDEVISDKQNFAQETADNTEAEIRDEAVRIDGMVSDIKDLAGTLHANIAACLRGRESYLESLPDVKVSDLQTCIANVTIDIQQEVINAERDLDADANNAVGDLDRQLDACTSGSILCVSPVLRQIESAIIVLPENIEKQAQQASNLADNLALEINECASSDLSDYVSSANNVLQDIQACVDKVLG